MTFHNLVKASLYYILSYDQQGVSDVVHCCERQSPHIFSYNQQAVSSDMTFGGRVPDQLFSYDHQVVCDIAHFCERQSDHIFSIL